jgi:hypothetical protein
VVAVATGGLQLQGSRAELDVRRKDARAIPHAQQVEGGGGHAQMPGTDPVVGARAIHVQLEAKRVGEVVADGQTEVEVSALLDLPAVVGGHASHVRVEVPVTDLVSAVRQQRDTCDQ